MLSFDMVFVLLKSVALVIITSNLTLLFWDKWRKSLKRTKTGSNCTKGKLTGFSQRKKLRNHYGFRCFSTHAEISQRTITNIRNGISR